MSDIAARPTNVIEIIASLTRSDSSAATAASLTRARETVSLRTVDEMSIAWVPGDPFTWAPPRRRSDSRILCVRLDDLAHETVANDIGISEIVKPDAVDSRQYALDMHESRILALGEIDLGLVAGDDGL